MSVPMASTKNYMNELFGTVLVLTALLSTASAVDCHGKSFHCVNSTHFMICVDLGGGVSQAIDDFYIACPPPTVCLGTNHFECEYPAPTTPATIRSTVISETTLPWENIITSSSLDNTTKEFSENYVNTERTTTVEYSVTTDTTVDVTTDTTVNVTTTGVTDFNINNDLNATKIVPTPTADIMTTPLESVSNDRNITEITITTEDVTTSVIETVTESTVEVSNRTNTYLGGVSKESNTNISDILVDKHSTGGYHGFPKAPLPHNQYNVSSTDISKPYPTELHTQTNGQSDPIKLGVNGSNFYNKTKQPTNEKGKNTPPQITEVNDTDNKTKSNFGITTSTQKPSISANTPVFPEVIVTASGPLTGGNDANQTKDTMGAENAIDAINLDRAITTESTGNAPSLEQTTVTYEGNFDKNYNQNTEPVNLDIKTTDTILDSNVELVTPHAPPLIQSSAGTPTVDAFTIETIQKVSTSENPTTIYEENLNKNYTQNTETVNLDIITTETILDNNVEILTTQAPLVIQGSEDAMTVDAFTIGTVQKVSSSEHPTTIYEENLNKNYTPNTETVNLDITTTETILDNNVELVTTEGPSAIQSWTDSTTVDAFTIETVEKVSIEHPTTNEYTQNLATLNLDSVTTEAMALSNSDVQLVTTQAPILMHSSANNTTLPGAFTTETIGNAPSQNIESVNVDIITTDAIDTPFNSDVQLVTTDAPPVTQNSVEKTTEDGAFTNELAEKRPSYEQPIAENEENLTKDSTQISINVDIVTTEAVHTTFLNSDVQPGVTQALPATLSIAEITILDGANNIETVTKAPSFEQPTTISDVNSIKESSPNITAESVYLDSTQTIDTVNLAIVTTEPVDGLSVSNVQLVTIQVPPLTQSSADTKFGGALPIETDENIVSTELPTTIYEQSWTVAENKGNVKEKSIIIPASKSKNEDIMTTETIFESTTIIKDQSILTNTETIKNDIITEQPITTNEENASTDNKVITTGHSVIFDKTVDDVSSSSNSNDHKNQGASTKVQLVTDTLVEETKVDIVFTTGTVGNDDGTTEASLITDTTQNTDSNILSISQDHTATETENVKTITSQSTIENSINNVSSLPAPENTVSVPELNNDIDFETAKQINVGKIIAKEPELVSKTELAIEVTTNNNYAQVELDNGSPKQKSKSESDDISKQILSQKGESKTILEVNSVPNEVNPVRELQSSIVEGQDQATHINWNPFENYLIDKSNKEFTTTSDDTNLKVEQNKFASQQRIISSLPVSSSIPALVYNRQETYNTTTVTQSAGGFLTINAHPENIMIVNSELETSTTEPILVKEPYLKTDIFASDGSDTLSSSMTLPTKTDVADTTISDNTYSVKTTVDATGSNDKAIKAVSSKTIVSLNKEFVNTVNNKDPSVADINVLDNTLNVNSIHSLYIPESETAVDGIGSNVKEIESNTKLSSDNAESVSLKNSKDATVVDTKILNNTHTIETISNLLISGPESTVDAVGNTANLSLDKVKFQNSKNSKNENAVDTKTLDSTHDTAIMPSLLIPGSKPTVEEVGSNVREIGSNAKVFSDNPESVNSKNSKDTTSVYTKIVDNTHNLQTTLNLLSPGSESTVDVVGSNVTDIGSNTKNKEVATVVEIKIMDNTFNIETQSTNDKIGNVKDIRSDFQISSDKTDSVDIKTSKDASVVVTKILDNTQNIEIRPNLLSPGSESTVGEIISNGRNIGSNVEVSSDKIGYVNTINNRDATVVDTKIVDNSHDVQTTPNLLSTGSESTVDEIGSNIKGIDKLILAKQNYTIELQSNTRQVSETINMQTAMKGDQVNDGLAASSKPVMLDILPLPVNNVKLRPLVAHTSFLTEVTSKTTNENVLTTESYESATVYLTQANIPSPDNINGVHKITPSYIKNVPIFDTQGEVTGKDIRLINPNLGGLTSVSQTQNRNDENNVVATASTLPEANSQTGVNNIVDISFNNADQTEKTNFPQTSVDVRDQQKNNLPTNLYSTTSTKVPYTNHVQAIPQSVAPNPITPVPQQVGNEASAAFTCVSGVRGRYSDKDDCRKFYICVGNNQPVVGNCPENTVFSDIKKLCTKNLSHCIRNNEFKCPSAGRFSDFIKDNVYYICVDHNNHLYRFKFQCQTGYALNKTTVKCIESKAMESNESVSISSSDTSSQTGSTTASSNTDNIISTSRVVNNNSSDDSTSTSNTDDVSMTKKTSEASEKSEDDDDDEEEVFKCKKEGKFPIRNECRRYYLCKKSRKSHYRRKVKKCDSGRVFHKDKKKCVHADSYEC